MLNYATSKDGTRWVKENSMSPQLNFKDFLGSNFGYLTDTLKGNIEGNNPIFDQLFGNASRRISGATDRNVRSIKENLASSGFRGTGANLMNEAYRSEKDALTQVSDDLSLKELSFKQNAINQLLGLNQQEGSTALNVAGLNQDQTQFDKNLTQQWQMFQENLNFQRENMPSAWEEILGSLLGSGTQIATAALL